MRYHNITKDDMLNGDGLRVVLWVAGCDHCCKECHNPVTWDPNGGLFFDEKAKAEIFEELEKDYISGITFSGGDPLHSANAYEVMMLAKEIKEKFPSKTIWLYTGYEWKDIKNMDIVNYLDVLVDGEFVLAQRNLDLRFRGSENQRSVYPGLPRAGGVPKGRTFPSLTAARDRQPSPAETCFLFRREQYPPQPLFGGPHLSPQKVLIMNKIKRSAFYGNQFERPEFSDSGRLHPRGDPLSPGPGPRPEGQAPGRHLRPNPSGQAHRAAV